MTSTQAGGQGDDSPSTTATLSRDTVYHLLQNGRRRLALRYLRGREGPVEMRDLAEQVAAWEHDTTVERLTSDQRQRVYISLYQCHLPKLDDEGVVAYDKDRGKVERTPLAGRLDRHLSPAAPSGRATAADAPAGGGEAPSTRAATETVLRSTAEDDRPAEATAEDGATPDATVDDDGPATDAESPAGDGADGRPTGHLLATGAGGLLLAGAVLVPGFGVPAAVGLFCLLAGLTVGRVAGGSG